MSSRSTHCLMSVLGTLALLFSALVPLAAPASAQSAAPAPQSVAIAGTLQSELGCAGDWMPACDKTFLTYDAEDDVWQGTFNVGPGDDQDKKGPRYKAALNGGWDENYGLKAQRGGADIPLVVPAARPVKFYYDHKTHWVTDNINTVIATVAGSFQTQLGCKKDNDPGCLRTWLEDPEGSGTYSFSTTALQPGTYTAVVAIGESLAETYGAGGTKGGAPLSFTVDQAGAVVYFGYDPATHQLLISTAGTPRGNLGKAQAHWLLRDTLAWNVVGSPRYTYYLHYSPDAALKLEIGKISGGAQYTLTLASGGPGAAVLAKYPQLTGFTTLKLSAADAAKVPDILKGQVALSVWDDQGKLLDATAVQTYGALDDLYTYTGPLGVVYAGDVPTLKLWAPTARAVTLHLFADSQTKADQTFPLAWDATTGVWSVTGEAGWTGQYYLYEVEVYAPATGKIEKNLVTDPYSFSLSTNSLRSQVVNLDAASLKPANWDTLAKPPLASPLDIVLYELHVRDFSISDQSVPAADRGTFKAFTVQNSNGMQHLRALAQAGLTHVHLLPAFDFASVDEDKSTWQTADPARLAALPPDSDQQQALLAPLADRDGFNWGYDPYHFTVPEGSYSTNPDGTSRIVEFREMVQGLSQAGLRVVMDVVYNHTTASGQDPKSVLDKVVPGYYHRLNAVGQVETSTCCQNTATEHNMMEKLMIDSVVTWARAYKVDGFRFDLMGHHMLANMVHVRQALDALTPAKDGVDGKAIYIYGEGWDFGEVANNARGQNATQLNIGGTGIGVFNDRLRDGVRGGNPFGDPREQGFSTGLALQPNAFDQGTVETQTARLLHAEEWIRAGLAGNLKGYTFGYTNALGNPVTAESIDYNGKPAAYTLRPQEDINYVSAHDNETLFDAVQAKAPAAATLADRVRMNNLALDVVLLGQGVPFFHAGDDLLRSKSLDSNSYNSGDWFNRLDWTGQTDNWGVGLPPEQGRWAVAKPLLGNPALRPAPADIQAAAAHFQAMLQVRKSARLFRLETAADVQARLKFYNTGPKQLPGLIVMGLDGTVAPPLNDAYAQIVVLFNAAPQPQTFGDAGFAGQAFALHPALAALGDAVLAQAKYDVASGAFTVPARTTAVFVVKRAPAAAPTTTAAPPTPAVAATYAVTATVVVGPTPAAYPLALPTPVVAKAAPVNAPGFWGLIVGVLVLLAAVGVLASRSAERR